jgi:phosphatidylserine/phosphatidylglycerophosphate/cardiolipin synthase-like enzyme
MANVKARAFVSPTLVLLAMDWADGAQRNDFLGFAIKRTPGFRPTKGAQPNKFDWLPNRLGFHGPNPGSGPSTNGQEGAASGKGLNGDLPSLTNPIQHFQWWDARIDSEDRGETFTYEISPVVTYDKYTLLDTAKATIKVVVPHEEEQGIGTYFNRAVVSSQAFSREFGHAPTGNDYVRALEWLSNGMSDGLCKFIANAGDKDLCGAAYHLTDNHWTIPVLQQLKDNCSFVYFFKDGTGSKGDKANIPTITALKKNKKLTWYRRTKTNIMHNKFIVRTSGDQPGDAEAVVTGTANFTTEGLTQQANVIHTIESPELASYYLQRQILLRDDPTKGKTAKGAAWSNKVQVGDATIRVFFAPEQPAANKKTGKAGSRQSINAVVKAVKGAQSSVFFSLFSATDKALLDACKGTADHGKLMRGLVNSISKEEPTSGDKPENASTVAATWLYERSKEDNMVVGHDSFGKDKTPTGFWWESNVLVDPNKKKPKGTKGKSTFVPNVYVHQKIVIVDGETDNPTIYVGSANLSGNSTWNNDENLLEITNCPRLAKAYVAEFMRLYEQYRSRFAWNRRQANGAHGDTFELTVDASWAKRDYTPGTMQYLARQKFAGTGGTSSRSARTVSFSKTKKKATKKKLAPAM